MSRETGQGSSAAPVASSAGPVERWLTEPFERAGWRGVARRYLLGGIIGLVLWGSSTVALAGLTSPMSGREHLVTFALSELTLIGAMVGVGWALLRDVAVWEAWEAAGRPPDEAARMLRLVLTSPIRIVNRGFGTFVLLSIPTVYAWVFSVLEPMAYAFVWCIGGFLYSAALVWPVAVFTAELSTRPVVARICAEFPQLTSPDGHGMSLRTRALLPVPAVTLTTGLGVGVLAGRFDDPAEQITSVILLSLVFTGAVALILRFVVTEAALRPVDDLIEGVERVATGDLASRVPITSADELAVLGRAVNEMTERLAAHDADMRASRARIVAASDEARRNVERDLHDGAQQYLVLLQLRLGQARRVLETDPLQAAEAVDEAIEELAHALAELRDLAHGIYPAVLESDGLPGALQAAAERSAIPVTVDAEGVGRHAQELEAAVYFCCLEALQNAAKHAGDGAKASVLLSQADGQLQFEVGDDGVGYEAAAVGPSGGLQNMADRIGALGGELQIESTPGSGTTVRGAVPTEVTR